MIILVFLLDFKYDFVLKRHKYIKKSYDLKKSAVNLKKNKKNKKIKKQHNFNSLKNSDLCF